MNIMTDLGMGTMVATIGDIMVETMGETMAEDIMVEEIMAVEIGDSWVKDYNIR